MADERETCFATSVRQRLVDVGEMCGFDKLVSTIGPMRLACLLQKVNNQDQPPYRLANPKPPLGVRALRFCYSGIDVGAFTRGGGSMTTHTQTHTVPTSVSYKRARERPALPLVTVKRDLHRVDHCYTLEYILVEYLHYLTREAHIKVLRQPNYNPAEKGNTKVGPKYIRTLCTKTIY